MLLFLLAGVVLLIYAHFWFVSQQERRERSRLQVRLRSQRDSAEAGTASEPAEPNPDFDFGEAPSQQSAAQPETQPARRKLLQIFIIGLPIVMLMAFSLAVIAFVVRMNR
jgi:hypothetical protein